MAGISNKIYIRADANFNIGMGHIMRCLSIADSLQAKGMDVTFVLAGEDAASLVKERGFEAKVLGTDYTNLEDEISIWSPEKGSRVIVDTYYVTKDYFESFQSKLGEDGKLIFIDDLGKFAYPVDMLINYNAFCKYIDYESLYRNADLPVPKMVMGVEYTPLRQMFRNIPKRVQNRDVKNVLVSTGGSDMLHIALKLVEYLKSIEPDFVFHILLGRMNPDGESIKKSAGNGIVVHENVTDMRSLISSCDIAVSAAGSTVYEISACGVPMITYVVADNQILGAKAMADLGLAVDCGDFREEKSPGAAIVNAVKDLASDYKKRVHMGDRMQQLIDGMGADRLSEAIVYSTKC